MIIEILLIMTLFLWLLSILPVPQITPYGWASNWLAFISVLLITLFLFAPGLRG